MEGFRAWAVAHAKMAKETIRDSCRRWAFLERNGVDWQVFFRSPRDARLQGDAFLTRRAMAADSPNLRTYERFLNRVSRYAASMQPTVEWPYWSLSKERRSEGKTLTEAQVRALFEYTCDNALFQARRRAMAWLAYWTRLRRSEVARLRLRDLNRETRRVWCEFPAKGGRKRWKPIPGQAWHPASAVQKWLAVRPQVDGSDALWTNTRWGKGYAMSVDAVGMEFQRMGQGLGFPVNFVRSRRAGSQMLQRHRVRTRIIKADLSHSGEHVTERYLYQDSVEDIEAELERCRVPGFANRSRGMGGSAAAKRAREAAELQA